MKFRGRTTYSVVPQDASVQKNWYPLPLRVYSLSSFVFLCCLIIVGLELTISACKRDGCPIIGSRVPTSSKPTPSNETSMASTFVYILLPTILSVLFGLRCAVIHHDCMRMEPWFQLSKSGGATLEDSLFLDYSYTFPLFIPFKAAKRRHFTVFASSCILLLTSAILTPMTATIFDQAVVNVRSERKDEYSVLQWDNIITEVGNTSTLPYSQAYMHSWFDSPLPKFTTENYSLEPWLATGLNLGSTNQSWTGSTVLYEADLECEEAERTPIVLPGHGVVGYILTWSNPQYYWVAWDPAKLGIENSSMIDQLRGLLEGGRNEGYEDVFQPGPEYYNIAATPLYNTSERFSASDVEATVYNVLNKYTASREGVALYIWASGVRPEGSATARTGPALPARWTAILCSPSLYVSQISATVLMPSGTVKNISRTSDRKQISGNSTYTINRIFDQFNLDPFYEANEKTKALLPNYDDSNNERVGLGYTPNARPNSRSQVVDLFGGTYHNPRVKSARVPSRSTPAPDLALRYQTNETLETLFDSEVLAAMYRSFFKLHFALFCRETWLRQGVNRTTSSDIVITTVLELPGFRVNELWCRGLEAGIAVVAILGVWLMLLGRHRPCHLDGEPNSLASTLAILHRSGDLTAHLAESEFQSMSSVKHMLNRSGARYCLVLEPDVGPRIEVSAGSVLARSYCSNVVEEKTLIWQDVLKDMWPTSVYSGALFVGFFALMAAVTIALAGADRAKDGIISPFPQSSFRYKMLFSYIPTLLGIIVEPLLVTLGTHYSMLGPYMPLRRGHASSKSSLSVDYDKSPPHFQTFRCIRSGDWTFGGLTVSILLANVLAVAFSGLFLPKTGLSSVILQVGKDGDPNLKGNFTGLDMMRMHYILAGNLVGEIKSPNWTTSRYYILPFTAPNTTDPIANVTATTIGLGANVHCSLLPPSVINITVHCLVVDHDYKSSTQTISRCSLPKSAPANSDDRTLLYTKVDDPCWPVLPDKLGNSTFEPRSKPTVMHSNLPADDILVAGTGNSPCARTLFAAWLELPADPDHAPNETYWGYLPHPNISVLRCNITHESVRLTAKVDAEGNVLEVKDIVPLVQPDVDRLHSGMPEGLVATFVNESAQSSYTLSSEYYTLGLQWYNSHMVLLHPEIVLNGSNLTHIPKLDVLPGAFEDVLRRLYSIALKEYATDLIAPLEEATESEAEVIVLKEKVKLSSTMMAIVVGILGYTTAVIVLLYWGPQGERNVGHAPKCLAAMWAHLYASDAKELCGEIRGASIEVRLAKLDAIEAKFSYGEFTGKDGNPHVGVFMEPRCAETNSGNEDN